MTRTRHDHASRESENNRDLRRHPSPVPQIGLPVTNACLEGFNGTIFCYGQTGSGKTYTTFGPPDEASWIEATGDDCRGDGRNPVTPPSGGSRGLVPRVLEYLFDRFSDGVDATTQVKHKLAKKQSTVVQGVRKMKILVYSTCNMQ